MGNITDKYVEKYIREVLPEQKGIFKEMEEYAEEFKVPIVHKEVAALLQVLAKSINAKRVLEVGTAIAYSTLLLCDAMKLNGGHITTIERNDSMVLEAKKNILKSGMEDRVRLIQGDAQDVLKFLDNEYDLIFLDGAKGQYNEFLNDCLHLLKPGGLLISDNILFKGMIATDMYAIRRKRTITNRMRAYLETICNHSELDTSIIPIGDGLAISYKSRRI
ncbi:O-methyltransferase [Alkaliphilus peptidifermentans]|uniref:tRNA 5-hydroxyuridine methyltransferase n=1 Tax=Alkaliphilus peptidifermentans DSM 18978 TaxID=1120976 RepID=A0A1G5KCD4_9FIRM|nr:O-methyltransferase [Alkaliphilus peptidifermentans]SCY98285.1 Predicted O-methyltransferase YrrM [Alkaliphilus peptidifermentans DSM 18978]